MKSEIHYKKMHECRVRLVCSGFLTDKQNEQIKAKIEAWGKKNNLSTVSDYLSSLKLADKALSKNSIDK